jgi:hypothetical protein
MTIGRPETWEESPSDWPEYFGTSWLLPFRD